MGLVLSFVDAQTASIAMAHGLTLVIRNIKDFGSIQGLRVLSWFAWHIKQIKIVTYALITDGICTLNSITNSYNLHF